jgi:hypothetical protein
MVLNKDFKEFIQLLNENDVRYLIIGGYAVGFHGFPRYTKDLDIWMEISENNADKIMKVMMEFGFGKMGFVKNDFLEPDTIIQLGVEPNRIDVIMDCPGLKFTDCWECREITEIGELMMNFIDFDNLKKNKLTVGRDVDIIDIKNLEIKKGNIKKILTNKKN